MASGNYKETARKNDTTDGTVKRVVEGNEKRFLQCKEQKKKLVEKDNKKFFKSLIEAREESLKQYIKKVKDDKVPANTLVIAIGVFTDKLGKNGDEEKPSTVIVKFPGYKDEPDKNS